MKRIDPAEEVALLLARIEKKRSRHQATAADERDLIRAKARQLKAELKARRRAA